MPQKHAKNNCASKCFNHWERNEAASDGHYGTRKVCGLGQRFPRWCSVKTAAVSRLSLSVAVGRGKGGRWDRFAGKHARDERGVSRRVYPPFHNFGWGGGSRHVSVFSLNRARNLAAGFHLRYGRETKEMWALLRMQYAHQTIHPLCDKQVRGFADDTPRQFSCTVQVRFDLSCTAQRKVT